VAAANGIAAVVDPAGGKLFKQWSVYSSFEDAVAFSPDGTKLATADFDGFVRIWDWRAGEETPEQIGAPIDVSELDAAGVDWSPDGRYLATTGGETLRLYDVETRRQIGSSVPISRWFPYVHFTPDGREVVAADSAGRVWVLPATVADWTDRACALANRNLTQEEWGDIVTDRPYEKVCP
jgi:WD40 repeat protein